jgi:predicted ATPase
VIKGLGISNFKCFDTLDLPLGHLTLLSGINGSGKSTVLQALLLLRQSWSSIPTHARSPTTLRLEALVLNGDLVQIGTAKDALYGYAEEQIISFKLVFADELAPRWVFAYDKGADVLQAIERESHSTDSVKEKNEKLNLQDKLSSTGLFGEKFQYLAAERIGPRTSFAMSDFVVRHLRQIGKNGELAVHFMTVWGTRELTLPALLHPAAAAADLGAQVEAWMDFICPGTRLRLTPHAGMDLVQLEYQFAAGRDVTDPFRPTNVGFGLTYTLPILVAVLSAAPGTLLLLENPEAHLHPQGQARMGDLLALAASAGVQIVVETHSDHVLNGVRLAVRNGRLACDAVSLHFFQRDVLRDEQVGDRPVHRVISPRIDKNGRISRRPDGFFDEWDKALHRLLAPAKV